MHTHDDIHAAAFSAALQVAAVNGARGLLAAEAELNPDVESICIVLAADGTFEVTCTDAAGRPIGGYAL